MKKLIMLIPIFTCILMVNACRGQGKLPMKNKDTLNEYWAEQTNNNYMTFFADGSYSFTETNLKLTSNTFGGGTYVYQPQTNEIFVDITDLNQKRSIHDKVETEFIYKRYFKIIEKNENTIRVQTVYPNIRIDWKIDSAGKYSLAFLDVIDHLPFRTETYFRADREQPNPARKYPLCILKKEEENIMVLNDLFKADESEHLLKQAYLNKGDFFLRCNVSYLSAGGHEVRKSKIAHYIPASNGFFKIETIQSASAEYVNGKEEGHQHPTKSWLQWKSEDYTNDSSDAALVLKYYNWRGFRFPNDINSVMARLNNWYKDEVDRYEREIKGTISPDDIMVAGETRGFIDAHKDILKELGAEAKWNSATKEYELVY